MYDIMQIVIAVASAAFYGLVFYMKNSQQIPPEPFDWLKIGATVLVGGIIGAVLQLTGIPITEAGIEVQLIAYAGITAMVEAILKMIWRKLSPTPT